jgi:hypothetical protein
VNSVSKQLDEAAPRGLEGVQQHRPGRECSGLEGRNASLNASHALATESAICSAIVTVATRPSTTPGTSSSG